MRQLGKCNINDTYVINTQDNNVIKMHFVTIKNAIN